MNGAMCIIFLVKKKINKNSLNFLHLVIIKFSFFGFMRLKLNKKINEKKNKQNFLYISILFLGHIFFFYSKYI